VKEGGEERKRDKEKEKQDRKSQRGKTNIEI
jgi:hypothetical protein